MRMPSCVASLPTTYEACFNMDDHIVSINTQR